MGEVVAFRPKPAPVAVDELAEITAWLKPASDWWTGRMQVEVALHYYKTVDYRRLLLSREQGRGSPAAVEASAIAEKAFNLWRGQCVRQMFIPAACVRHLRWKQEWARVYAGDNREIGIALARDEAALAGRIQVARRPKAAHTANRKTSALRMAGEA